MQYNYKPRGVCSSEINFELDGTKIRNISFRGGCNGNLKAISKLCEGMEADEIIAALAGNTCGYKSTSCADQLTIAIKKALDTQLQSVSEKAES